MAADSTREQRLTLTQNLWYPALESLVAQIQRSMEEIGHPIGSSQTGQLLLSLVTLWASRNMSTTPIKQESGKEVNFEWSDMESFASHLQAAAIECLIDVGQSDNEIVDFMRFDASEIAELRQLVNQKLDSK